MNITADLLKSIILKKGYIWYDEKPNLIGIRTTLQVPDIFNDIFCLVWKQPGMPPPDILGKQKWLNSWLYVGANGAPLSEDGDAGSNTEFALKSYIDTVNTYRLKMWVITTDPGTYWLNNPMSTLGTAVYKPGQYIDAYQIGFHHNKPDHPALIQSGAMVEVYRDNDKDNTAEEVTKVEKGYFGCNIHRANTTGKTMAIGKWSAGCIVFQVKSDHNQLMTIVNNYKSKVNNKFTFTLLKETDLA